MGATLHIPFSSSVIALTLSAPCFFQFSLIQADRNGGFSVQLIHHDSPVSPLYDPLETPSQRVTMLCGVPLTLSIA
ncbi:hypothetical protein FF1_027948 [Malus domestica]|uniref:Secreted protein n=1 Tax=Malus baccata TaxID=106549 RepID=A0A540NH95_MALBA|nr:hypothetical protein C1H46_004014 [Malus baccata]